MLEACECHVQLEDSTYYLGGHRAWMRLERQVEAVEKWPVAY